MKTSGVGSTIVVEKGLEQLPWLCKTNPLPLPALWGMNYLTKKR